MRTESPDSTIVRAIAADSDLPADTVRYFLLRDQRLHSIKTINEKRIRAACERFQALFLIVADIYSDGEYTNSLIVVDEP